MQYETTSLRIAVDEIIQKSPFRDCRSVRCGVVEFSKSVQGVWYLKLEYGVSDWAVNSLILCATLLVPDDMAIAVPMIPAIWTVVPYRRAWKGRTHGCPQTVW